MMRLVREVVSKVVLTCLMCTTVTFASSTLPSRTSDGGGVRVVVTPKPHNVNAATWDFEVVLDTHTKPLTDDLAAASSLIDDQGRAIPAKLLKGDPPGGHHRKGVLQFPVPSNSHSAVELRVQGVGGVDVRTFRWDVRSQD